MAQRRMFSKRIVESARLRTKSKGNEAAYNFIKDQGLQKESA